MEQKCVLKRQILQHVLSLASIVSDEIAYRIMKTPGYIAIITGEAMHLIKCLSNVRYGRWKTVITNFLLLIETGPYSCCLAHEYLSKLAPSGTTRNSYHRCTKLKTQSRRPRLIESIASDDSTADQIEMKVRQPIVARNQQYLHRRKFTRLRDHIMFSMENLNANDRKRSDGTRNSIRKSINEPARRKISGPHSEKCRRTDL